MALIDRLLEEEEVMSSRAPTFPAVQAGGWGVIYRARELGSVQIGGGNHELGLGLH